MRFTGFIGPSYVLSSVNVDCQRCINLYPEIDEQNTGKEGEVASLVGTPGLRELAVLSDAPFRGMWFTSTGRLFVVAKNVFYEVFSDFTYSSIGTLASFSGTVSMSDNGLQLVVVDGPNGYVYDFAASTFTQIEDVNFHGADIVCFLDGYFIFNWPGTKTIYTTAGTYEVVFNEDNSAVEGSPDKIVGMITNRSDLWILKENTTEIWYDAGLTNAVPFQRNAGAFIEHGCAARFSVAKINNTIFWLGRDTTGRGVVYSAQGYSPTKVSTTAVDIAIQSYGDISDAVGYTYQQDGHYFYVLNFTNANTTWVYDASINLWHERAFLLDGVLQRHRANYLVFAFGKHIAGDYSTSMLYQLDPTYFYDDFDNGEAIVATPIMRRRVSPHMTSGLKRIFYNSFQLDVQTGVGLDGIGVQGNDPQAILEFSKDAGRTWSNERWVSLGKIGEYLKRCIWRRLGQARDMVFRVTITDPVKVVLIGAELDIVKGEN